MIVKLVWKISKKCTILGILMSMALLSGCSNNSNIDSNTGGSNDKNIISEESDKQKEENTVEDEMNLTQEEFEKKNEEIISEMNKPESEKEISEVEKKAGSVLTYKGVVTNFTTLGSKGNLEVAVGELNVDVLKNRVFEINLSTLVYDNMEGKIIDTTKIPMGSACMVYAMDNSQTSAIVPVAVVLSPTDNIHYISLDKIENFNTLDSNVALIYDKFSSDLYYVDDKTVIVSGLSEQPLLLEGIKSEDKLFILTGEHEKVEESISSTDDNNSNSDNKDTSSTTSNSDSKVKDLKSKSKYVKRIAVYREATE